MERNPVEPWLRGTVVGVPQVIAQVIYSFDHAIEDLEFFSQNLTSEQIWQELPGIQSVAVQIKHIAGSLDRLWTYCAGRALSDKQLTALATEQENNAETREDLLRHLASVIERVSKEIRKLDPSSFDEPREVGRQKLPTSVGGLLVHMAEHTQRHVGQVILTAKVVKLLESKKG